MRCGVRARGVVRLVEAREEVRVDRDLLAGPVGRAALLGVTRSMASLDHFGELAAEKGES